MTEAVSLGELIHEEALFGLTGVRKVGIPRGRLFPSELASPLASYPGPHITVFPLEGLVTMVCTCA